MLVGRYGREPKLSYPSREVDTGENRNIIEGGTG